uniref:Uncharacterized protein n=1 Tax=Rhizophora mucronata TaxID=61149 RepID=A0A2P2QYJ8_RHIMU
MFFYTPVLLWISDGGLA